jgi:hypothetical protein
MGGFERGAHREQSFRRGAERIFIRGELDDLAGIGAELARGLFDRLSRFVNGEVAQLLVRDIPDG